MLLTVQSVISDPGTPTQAQLPSFPCLKLYFHAQEQPLVTGDINGVCPHIQLDQLESNPSKALHESPGVVFWDGSIEADDYLGDGEDGLSKFD
jgi:hypothetical protein